MEHSARDLPQALLEAWTFTCGEDSLSVILPDGCRDLILLSGAGDRPEWLVSSLADRSYVVPCHAGDHYVGFRLQPASRFDESELLRAARSVRHGDDDAILSVIADLVRVDVDLAEILDCLAELPSIIAASRRLGVSDRQLERRVKAATGRTPGFWRSLARVRRAAAALSGAEPLAAVAADFGYSDQAHMSRDFRKWFAATPSEFRRRPALLASIRERGY